ncbi:Uncharacterised protein [Sphingomonas paucimobilis]|nr:Uncharacterised protein [Sphingomonas paucimobilis]
MVIRHEKRIETKRRGTLRVAGQAMDQRAILVGAIDRALRNTENASNLSLLSCPPWPGALPH